MLPVKGRYENGVVQPLEHIDGYEGQEVIITFLSEDDNEAAAFADLRAASLPTLLEYWDNEADAVYDNLIRTSLTAGIMSYCETSSLTW